MLTALALKAHTSKQSGQAPPKPQSGRELRARERIIIQDTIATRVASNAGQSAASI